jgi:ATP-dependent protease HslVU (ClpYQ) peptidase subunit
MNTPIKVQDKIRDNLLRKAVDNTEDWYKEEIRNSNIEFLAWLESEVK